jgi:formylglycine-generating enzyme required for sulfatase activity
MVVVPAGSFVMGSPKDEKGRRDDEGPQHKVTIARSIAVGKFEVTFDEWDACVAAGGCSHKPEDAGWGRGRRPVINVSWEDAQGYVRWLSKKTGKSYRLLSEAEWEYAARAGTETRYPWGDEPGSNRANFRESGSQWSNKQTAPMGSFAPNAFGLHDMIGNVWEWTQDCWNGSYEGAPEDGRPWESGDCGRRVVRGGSWWSNPENARSASRRWLEPGYRGNGLGFRLARTL